MNKDSITEVIQWMENEWNIWKKNKKQIINTPLYIYKMKKKYNKNEIPLILNIHIVFIHNLYFYLLLRLIVIKHQRFSWYEYGGN